MLTDHERSGIREEMAQQMLLVFPSVGPLLSEWLGRHGTRIDTFTNMQIFASQILRYCERYGWIEDPALLLALLNKVALNPRTPYGPQIPSIVDKIAALQPPIFWSGGRAWDTCHLSMHLPFLNRDATRRAFEHFDNPLPLEPDAARVLVVNGPPGSGKSFTLDFLRLLVGLRADQNLVVDFDFGAWTGQPLTPDVLAVELAVRPVPEDQRAAARVEAEQTVPRLDNQSEKRWSKQLALWLAGEANKTGKTWHIALDNFGRPGVPAATHVFIQQLAAVLSGSPIAWDVQDTNMGPPLRLVLLHYPDITPAQNRLMRIEQIQPITADRLKDHFRRYYKYQGWAEVPGAIDLIVARYEPRLAGMFPTAPSAGDGNPPRWKMRELAEVVLRDCEEQARRRAAAASGTEAASGAPASA